MTNTTPDNDKLRDFASRICQQVAELPDRNSPEDWPEAMLVTHDELTQIIIDAAALLAEASTTGPMCRDCADFGPICPNSGKPCAGASAAPKVAGHIGEDGGHYSGPANASGDLSQAFAPKVAELRWPSVPDAYKVETPSNSEPFALFTARQMMRYAQDFHAAQPSASVQEPVAWEEKHTMAAIRATASFGAVNLTSEYGPYDIDRPTFHCDRFVEAIVAARDAQWHAAVTAAKGAEPWQPIASAPKDGKMVMLGYAPDGSDEHADGEVAPGYWLECDEDGPDNMGHDAGFVDCQFGLFRPARHFGNPAYQSAGFQPTHWQPLPAPPSGIGNQGGSGK